MNEIILSEEQQKAVDLLNAGENVFLTGYAGTGKSTIINYFCGQSRKRIMRCAPTAIAAKLVSGATVHSTFGVPISLFGPDAYANNQKVYKNLRCADIIIIDEVSMVRADTFQFIWNTIQKSGNDIQLVVVGDFCQLPPVIKIEDKKILKKMWGKNFSEFCFTSSAWQEANFTNVMLHQVFRQNDIEFLENLQKIKMGDASGLPYFNGLADNHKDNDEFCISITCKNATANEINLVELEKIDGPTYKFEAKKTGKYNEQPAPKELVLKTNCKVVALVNKMDNFGSYEYRNGDFGTVLDIDDRRGTIKILWDNGTNSELEKNLWENMEYDVKETEGKKELVQNVVGTYEQFPLRLAYAITVHKSQGQTYEAANLYPGMFSHGQLYVSLSRVKSPDGLHIQGKFSEKDIITDPVVLDFMNKVEKNPKLPLPTIQDIPQNGQVEIPVESQAELSKISDCPNSRDYSHEIAMYQEILNKKLERFRKSLEVFDKFVNLVQKEVLVTCDINITRNFDTNSQVFLPMAVFSELPFDFVQSLLSPEFEKYIRISEGYECNSCVIVFPKI